MKNSNETRLLCMICTWHSWFVNDNHSKRLWENLDYKVTPFPKIFQYMHSLNLIFVLSRESCLSFFQANRSAYDLSSKSSPFLPALLQELFLFSVPLFSPSLLVSTLQSLPLQIYSVPKTLHKSFDSVSLELLPILLFFTKLLKRMVYIYCLYFLPLTSHPSAILLLFPYKGTVWSLGKQPMVLLQMPLFIPFLAFKTINTPLPIFECPLLQPLWCYIFLLPPNARLWLILISSPLQTL